MAFQMIPPRLSSSPPPLDSLPPVSCPGVDEDDEFDHFSSHNASFDITGLSDKLPPTPESSPSRFPGIRLGPTTERGLTEGLEGTLEDSISQDSGVDSSNHPHEFSPQPQGDGQPCSREDLSGGDGGRVDRELSDIEQSDVDDFGDFQGVCDGESGENVSRGKEEEVCLDSKAENTSQDWDNSQMSQISSQPLAKESDKLKCKESESARHRADTSPPPLDCVIEDEMCSSSPVPDDDDDDTDFGDFATHEAAFHLSNGTNTDDKCSSDTTLDNHQLSHINTMASSTTPNTVHPITSTTERLQADGDSQDEDSTCKTSRVTRSVEGEGNEEEEEEGGKQEEDSCTSLQVKGCVRSEEENEVVIPDTTEETQTPPSSLTPRDERGAGDGMATSQGNTREESEESTVNEELRTGDKLGTDIDNVNDDKSLSGNESVVPESDEGVKESEAKMKGREGEEGEVELESDATERLSDVCGNENESDFGDFNQAENDDDDDDLDFADLRKQVEEGMYGEFGDFTSGFGEGNDDDGDGDGDDFGDFTASADTKTKSECNDFGDFVVPGKENVGEDDLSQNFNEDFGDFNEEFGDFNEDFGDFNAPENSEALKGFTTPAAQEAAHFQTHEESICKTSPVLQKLESLVTKWIPRTAAPQEDSCSVPLLHQTIESDAFVWRQLENLESSAALRLSWGNTQAHTLFLSSVNVDARNIVSKTAMITLFGQKWSSSVPLFAQTLSFSPLTPAKSTEGSGGGSGGVVLPGTTKDLPPDTTTTTTAKQGQHKKSSVSDALSVSANGGSEEQIPPAKFDWTSSGLTNPLEGPGLEQEFLSEGGDKGTGGRASKAPPTPSPLVQQILGGGMSKVPSPATPLQSLTPEVRQVVTQLPNLSFMRSRVLMFPIRGDQ